MLEDVHIAPLNLKEQPKSKWDDEDVDENDVKESWEDEDEPAPFLGFMWNPLSWVMEAAAIMAIKLANGGADSKTYMWRCIVQHFCFSFLVYPSEFIMRI
ncbi:hypothetical protein K1719_037038 [Acacia pycnantha]|nr:hypothetical protein K1719_037038 [Acacia pycnantha]